MAFFVKLCPILTKISNFKDLKERLPQAPNSTTEVDNFMQKIKPTQTIAEKIFQGNSSQVKARMTAKSNPNRDKKS